jgi:ATP-dependent helicase HrpA
MLAKDKVLALVKSLHQRPRSRLVPLPEFAAEFRRGHAFGEGSLLDVLLKAVRERTQLPCSATTSSSSTVQPAPVHELPHRRRAWPPARHRPQPGQPEGRAGRPGAQSAFQALAALKVGAAPAPAATASAPRPGRHAA